ncbi:MAG: hypothetical protein RIS43_142 [Actinomycetota bacterium]
MATNQLQVKRNRQRLLKRLRIGAAATVALLLVQVFYFSDVFAVQKVEVVGIQFATAKEVIAAADISLGTPIARVDADGVAKRVSDLPAVASVEVRRVWPHSIVLAVTEPTPVAVVGSAGNWQYVDHEGEIFGRLKSKPKGLLSLSASKPAARKAAAEVATALPTWLKDQVVTVSATSGDDVSLRLNGNLTVRFGSAERIERKAAVLKALLKVKARIYDVSAPDVPITIK